MKDDTISRAAALSALADYIHNVDRVMGDGHLSADDCMDAARSVLGEDELPSAQPVNIAKLQPNCNQVASDCISRQAMINEIDLHVGILYDSPTLVESLKLLVRSLPSAQSGEDIRAMCGECDAWNQYKNYPQPRWIPVTERLPQNGYWLWSANGGVVKKDFYWDGHWELAEKYGYEVLAWMPLPTPYREGGQDG